MDVITVIGLAALVYWLTDALKEASAGAWKSLVGRLIAAAAGIAGVFIYAETGWAHGGGEVVAGGRLEDIESAGSSLTGRYLSGELKIDYPGKRRKGTGKSLVIKNARQHNLRNLDVEFPLGLFICVTGVSGSGKSSLAEDILYRSLSRKLHRALTDPGDHDTIVGVEHVDKVIEIDQSPIGRTPRSNPATYTGLFTPIRELFALLPESRIRGYSPGRFSFKRQGRTVRDLPGGRAAPSRDELPPRRVCYNTRRTRPTRESM